MGEGERAESRVEVSWGDLVVVPVAGGSGGAVGWVLLRRNPVGGEVKCVAQAVLVYLEEEGL